MFHRIPFLFVFVVLVGTMSSCVQVRLRNANDHYEQYAYASAVRDYELVLKKKNDPQAIINAADCYRQIGNSVKAEFWYRKAVKLPDAKPEWDMYLAEALMKNGNYVEAKTFLQSYLELNKTDFRAQRMVESCNNMKLFFRDTSLYSVSSLRINVPGNEYFSPAFYKYGIVFLSDQNYKGLSRAVSDGTGRRYLDLFYAKRTDRGNWMEAEPLRGDVNGRFNEGPVVFSPDFNTMYFTRNNYVSNKPEKNKKNINVLKIFKAEATDGIWSIKGEMKVGDGDFSVGHPAISRDGNTLFFVSDMPWGYGGTDIYSVTKQGNNWSQPVNLGPNINSDGNEMFPFIWNDSTIYFASDGLTGMGGLDVFESHLEQGSWTKAVNIGAPINSAQDDFGYIADSSGLHGFFTSSRNGILDKIYSFSKNAPDLLLRLRIEDQVDHKAIAGVAIMIQRQGARDTTVYTNSNGTIAVKAVTNKVYSFSFDHKDYYFTSDSISTIGKQFSETTEDTVSLRKVQLNKPFIWTGVSFKKKDWLPQPTCGPAMEKLVTLLRQNPRLVVEVASYTDSRGTDPDNIKLTQRRADIVAQYLMTHGIKSDRITAKGYGEAKLLNQCTNGLLCIEEEHEANNRIEITVQRISNDTAFK
jgi:hypothetical protein